MEYSDLFIALSRAQGIPARAAYGYGYDPKYPPDEQEEHQWIQTWVPDYGWLTIDPTWGETGREFIGRDLDHALWYVASIHPDEPTPLSVIAATTDFEIEDSTIEVTAVEEIPSDIILETIDELVEDIGEESSSFSQISRVIQTSIIGQMLVILLPICSTTFVGVLLLMLLVKLFKKIFQKKQGQPLPTAQVQNQTQNQKNSPTIID